MTPTRSAGTRLTETSPCVKLLLLRWISSKRPPNKCHGIEGGVKKSMRSQVCGQFPRLSEPVSFNAIEWTLKWACLPFCCCELWEADPPNAPNELLPSPLPETQTPFLLSTPKASQGSATGGHCSLCSQRSWVFQRVLEYVLTSSFPVLVTMTPRPALPYTKQISTLLVNTAQPVWRKAVCVATLWMIHFLTMFSMKSIFSFMQGRLFTVLFTWHEL